MDIKQLIHDDDAVSPVIGVILMVAITVILAAVIASFVLGLGDQAQQTTPQASFSWNYDESGSDTGVITLTHDGGDSIEAQELYVRGSGLNDNSEASGDHLDSTGTWSDSGAYSDSSEVTAGLTLDIEADDDYSISVVYEPVEGDTSATLSEDTGPDA
jgi:flagellin-like protein